MLEREWGWDEMIQAEQRRICREAFIRGNIQGKLEATKSYKNIRKIYDGLQGFEAEKDMLRFMEKYPTYSSSQLAKRILCESEYWR